MEFFSRLPTWTEVLGGLAAVAVGGYIVANAPAFHRGPTGLGSCSGTADVASEAFRGRGGAEGKPLRGRLALVTGATPGGIGFETAAALVKLGAHVHLPLRSGERCREVKKALRSRVGEEAEHLVTVGVADLADIDSVRAYAKRFKAAHSVLHIAIFNAAVMALPERRATSSGHEMQMGVNYLANVALFDELLEPLLKAGADTDNGPARVVLLTSSGHRRADPTGSWLESPTLESKTYGPWEAYGNSKMACMLFAREIHERYAQRGIVACSVHPGGIHTGLQSHVSLPIAAIFLLLTPWFFKSLDQGASTSLFAATHPAAVNDKNKAAGRFFEDCNASEPYVEPMSSWLKDAALRRKFWDLSFRLVSSSDEDS